MKMKCSAVSGESTMTVTVVRQESDRKGWRGERAAEQEGEDRGRRQERRNEGEGHIYRFPAEREKQHQSSTSNKFIVPESRFAINYSNWLDRGRIAEPSGSSTTWVKGRSRRENFSDSKVGDPYQEDSSRERAE
jgi:hypothetical protein